MKCKKGKFCNNFVFSESVTVDTDTLVVNVSSIPSPCGCLAITQVIPDTATVNMPVVVTIGEGTEQYPLIDKCGVQLSAGRLDIRRRYQYRYISANTTSIIKLYGTRCPYNTMPGVIFSPTAP